MKEYKIETKINPKNSFSIICVEDNLERMKLIVKDCSEGAKCYYREYPLTKNNKIYF